MKFLFLYVSIILYSCLCFGFDFSDENTNKNVDNTDYSIAPTEVYNLMLKSDKDKLLRMISFAPETYEQSWKNPHTGIVFDINSIKIYLDDQGRPCRNYSILVYARGTEYDENNLFACRMRNTKWVGLNNMSAYQASATILNANDK